MKREDLMPASVAMRKRQMEFSSSINTIKRLGEKSDEWVEEEWKNFYRREYEIMKENGTVPSEREVQEYKEWWSKQEDIGKVERMVYMTPLINVKTIMDEMEKK